MESSRLGRGQQVKSSMALRLPLSEEAPGPRGGPRVPPAAEGPQLKPGYYRVETRHLHVLHPESQSQERPSWLCPSESGWFVPRKSGCIRQGREDGPTGSGGRARCAEASPSLSSLLVLLLCCLSSQGLLALETINIHEKSGPSLSWLSWMGSGHLKGWLL